MSILVQPTDRAPLTLAHFKVIMSILMSALVQDAHEQHALSKCKQFSFSGIRPDAHQKRSAGPFFLNVNRMSNRVRGARDFVLGAGFLCPRKIVCWRTA